MLHQVLPRIEVEASTQNYGRYAIGPMARGYGTTIGIALRRVLLSSLPGAAITSVRVAGVPHEFTTIPGAKEDMTMLLLNLKQVHLISYSEDQVRMRVSARGKSVITAGDIEAPSTVEIVNPELQLLTLDTLDSDLEIELTVERGVGYSPAEDRRNLPIGQIPVDAVFSPIVKVNHTVEPARIEQITNYDLLKLEIWTNGTIRPSEALTEAARILIQHLSPLAEFTEVRPQIVAEAEARGGEPREYDDVPIEELELSMRAYNCLKRANITTVGDIMERLQEGASEMLAIRNFGEKSLAELIEKLIEKGFLPPGYVPEP
ncbi:MAG: DNA-directed RNA polymerase subunit alpha [Chloroflexi bacterium]|nr:DNA-directed RNA polymerase subunit alpha [Chloroflexota bacterium]